MAASRLVIHGVSIEFVKRSASAGNAGTAKRSGYQSNGACYCVGARLRRMAYLPPQRTFVDMITFDAGGKLVLLGDLNPHPGQGDRNPHVHVCENWGVENCDACICAEHREDAA